jgi:hypothetical protein
MKLTPTGDHFAVPIEGDAGEDGSAEVATRL